MEKRRIPLYAIMLAISILNYSRLEGNENIHAIQFVSIFVIGALSGVLIVEIARIARGRNN